MNERLKNLRDEKELNQEDIAKLLKTTRQNYSRWETGELLPPLKHLNFLANYFNTNIDYIMELSDNPNSTKKIINIDYAVVGKNIKTVRINNNLSMRELAKIINTSHSTISSYESGKTLITISFALDIAKRFNISLDWLVGRK